MEALEFQQLVDWDDTNEGFVSVKNRDLNVEVVQGKVRCDHETCYETHETLFVFKVGDQHFARKAEYSSYDGLVWRDNVMEVRAVETVVSQWGVMEPTLPQPPFTAAQVEEAFEHLIDEYVSFMYQAPVTKFDPNPSPEAVTAHNWSELVEYVECGTIWVKALGNLPITHVKTSGAFELSSSLRCVFQIGDQTFMKTGTWVSFDGARWTGALTEVVEREKTVKYWDAV